MEGERHTEGGGGIGDRDRSGVVTGGAGGGSAGVAAVPAAAATVAAGSGCGRGGLVLGGGTGGRARAAVRRPRRAGDLQEQRTHLPTVRGVTRRPTGCRHIRCVRGRQTGSHRSLDTHRVDARRVRRSDSDVGRRR